MGKYVASLVADAPHYAAVAFCQTPGSGKSQSVAPVGGVPALCLFHLLLFLKVIAGCLEAQMAPLIEEDEPAAGRKASFWRIVRLVAEAHVGEVKLIMFAFDEAGTICQGREEPEVTLPLGGPYCPRGQGAQWLFGHLQQGEGYLPEESSSLPGNTSGKFARLFRPVYWLATSGILQASPEVLEI